MSHTVSVNINFKNKEAVAKVAESMGATIIGEGHHQLYSSSHAGFAFKLPRWQYAMVVDEDGKIHYDNYNGMWGNSADVETLQDKYAIMAVEAECDNLGWYHELNEQTGELIVHHPAGGVITVQKGGTLDASGFSGTSCQDATLKLEQAMGNRLGETLKPQINEVQINQSVIE